MKRKEQSHDQLRPKQKKGRGYTAGPGEGSSGLKVWGQLAGEGTFVTINVSVTDGEQWIFIFNLCLFSYLFF